MKFLTGSVICVLVVPTLAVTAARLLPGDTLWWVILRACTPLAIIPYSLAAIVLSAATWKFSDGARHVAAGALLVVVALLCLHVRWVAGPYLADAPGSPSTDTFTVMTANLHIGRADPAAVLDMAIEDDVDVLVLEEITPPALAALDRAGLSQLLSQRAGNARPGRDGIMIFTKTQLSNLRQIGTSSPGYEVEVAMSRGLLHLVAVHPTAPNNGVAQWADDLDVVVETTRTIEGATVVTGDFNATVDHPPIQALMSAGFRDASATAGLGWRPTWPSPGNVRRAGLAVPSLFGLDHVFIRGTLQATHAHTRVVPGTDHRALVTRIAWTDLN